MRKGRRMLAAALITLFCAGLVTAVASCGFSQCMNNGAWYCGEGIYRDGGCELTTDLNGQPWCRNTVCAVGAIGRGGAGYLTTSVAP